MKKQDGYFTATTTIGSGATEPHVFKPTYELRQVKEKDGSISLQQRFINDLGVKEWRYVPFISLRD